MPAQTFNTVSGRTVARELLIAYLNTGTTSNPIWDPLGRRVQDSSTELDWESDTVRDILGNTYGIMKKPKIIPPRWARWATPSPEVEMAENNSIPA